MAVIAINVEAIDMDMPDFDCCIRILGDCPCLKVASRLLAIASGISVTVFWNPLDPCCKAGMLLLLSCTLNRRIEADGSMAGRLFVRFAGGLPPYFRRCLV
jgi:hypothetical protein